MNQWANNEEKQDEEKCGPFQKLSKQGEQRCSEPSVVCLGDTQDMWIRTAIIQHTESTKILQLFVTG